jgi:DNA-binding NtrC family response regulator
MNQPLMMVVDDEAGVRQSLQMVFGKIYRVIEAPSADEAIQKLTDEKPDVVLLDIMMPGSDGLAVLRQIKSIHPDCQVIMLTGLNTARTAFAAKGTGAFDYVTKPFDVEELSCASSMRWKKFNCRASWSGSKKKSGANTALITSSASQNKLSMFSKP